MSVITDDSNNIIDPEAEVRKLQDLVKKLEQQNQLLRNKQNEREKDDVFSRTETLDTDFITTPPSKNGPDPAVLKESLKNLTLDDVALVEVDGETQEEDSWLYQSPVKPSPSQKVVSPYKWARKEFEQPSPDIESAKKSLLYKLEECACRDSPVSRSASVGTLGSSLNNLSLPGGGNGTMRLGSDRPRAASAAGLGIHSSGSMPSIRQPAIGLANLKHSMRVNTGTFTRPKKAKMPAEDPPPPQVNNLVSEAEPLAEEAPQETEEDGDDAPDGTSHKLTDVSDVQVLARMQEESLRQSFSSPHSLSKKSLSRSMNRSGLGLNDDSPSSNRSSPGRYEGDAGAVTRSNNSLDALSSHSSCSTPPDSPYASNQHLDSRTQVPDHRRSLPNLQTSRLSTPALQHHGSEGRLQPRDSPPRRGGGNQQRQRAVGSAARQASPGRPQSPQRCGIPSPRTSIPRPGGGGSRLPTPGKKGGIPMGRRSTGNIRSTLTPAAGGHDDSWKDGCF